MGSKRKKHNKAKYLRDDDVVFGTLVYDTDATIVAEQGMVMLVAEGDPHPFFLPEGVVLGHEAYGQTVSITVRAATHEVILKPDEDDIYEKDLESNPKLMPVDDWAEVKNLLEECKLRQLSKDSKALSTCIAGIALTTVSAILWRRGFFYPMLCVAGMPLGILVALCFGLRPFIRLIRSLNTHIICDSAGNYINVETGKTNMNGGMILPVE